MGRREFVLFVGGSAVGLLATRVLAQPKPLPKLGILGGVPPAFFQGMRDHGLVDGKTISIISGKARTSDADQLARDAAMFVSDNVSVIFATGSSATVAAKNATSAVPIVSLNGDPIGLGFAQSLARPGGNITGLSLVASEVIGKRLELLKRIVPNLERVALFWSPADPEGKHQLQEAEVAAESLALKIQGIDTVSPNAIAPAFAAAADGKAQAVLLAAIPMLDVYGPEIAALALKGKMPLMGFTESFPKRGALIGYGPSVLALFQRAAYYIQQILAGVRPAELPIEQPTKFNLVINLKTASALGLSVPDALLALADEVIE